MKAKITPFLLICFWVLGTMAWAECTLESPDIPCTLECVQEGGFVSALDLTAVDYTFSENADGTADLILRYTGKKTYDSLGEANNAACAIEWKLLDAEDYVVRSGTSYTSRLAQGDKFRNNQDTIPSLEPGAYTLRILNKAPAMAASTPLSESQEKADFLSDYTLSYLPDQGAWTLFFSLKNSKQKRIAVDAEIDIVIQNAYGEEVYRNTHRITASDYSVREHATRGKILQAAVVINASSVKQGSWLSGSLYFTVRTAHRTFAEKKLKIASLPMLSGAQAPTRSAKTATPKPQATQKPQNTVPPRIAKASYQLGDNTDEVLEIKRRMQLLGYFSANADLTGNYNSLMQERIRQFQADYGLKQTGLIDSAFLNMLYGARVNREIAVKRAEEIEKNAEKSYMSSCTAYDYTEVARNPNNYKGLRIKASGKVIQVMEGSGGDVTLRVRSSGNNVWYITITLDSGASRILENDRVTVYGVCQGVTTYQTVMGSTLTIPKIEAKYIEIQ